MDALGLNPSIESNLRRHPAVLEVPKMELSGAEGRGTQAYVNETMTADFDQRSNAVAAEAAQATMASQQVAPAQTSAAQVLSSFSAEVPASASSTNVVA